MVVGPGDPALERVHGATYRRGISGLRSGTVRASLLIVSSNKALSPGPGPAAIAVAVAAMVERLVHHAF
jgi:hypothetical protein